jgi:hypothetical protein
MAHKKAAGRPDKEFSKSTEIQGGGESGEEKSKLHHGKPSLARNTMGHGAKSSNDTAIGAMGKNQQTGDGGASDW